MKRERPLGFTLLELLCVMAIIGLLASLLFPVLEQGSARAKRLQCLNNLRQAGLAFQLFAHDHNGAFPMAVPEQSGGSREFVQRAYQLHGEFYFAFRCFQVLSNELVTPRLLVCPSDNRVPSPSFSALQNDHLSYFVGLKADYRKPSSILAGDRNITNDLAGAVTLVQLGPNHFLRWTHELHQFKGNLLLADGSVQESKNLMLAAANNQPAQPVDLFLPSLKTTSSVASDISLPLAGVTPGTNIPCPTNQLAAYGPTSYKMPASAPALAAGTAQKQKFEMPAGPEPLSAKPKETPTNRGSPRIPSAPLSSDSISMQGASFPTVFLSGNVIAWLMLLLILLFLALMILLELRRRVKAGRRAVQESYSRHRPK
jgi:prepilin-type N-terminal cleavage/methylation domain-containing protein